MNDEVPDVAAGMRSLQETHDEISAAFGGAYVSISASWTGPDGRLHSIMYSTTDPTDPDDPDDV